MTQREIKFRAYNKDWRMMVQPEDIEAIMFDGVTAAACDVKFNITTTDGQRNTNVWEDSPDIILMQFTGLRDRHGKEIYESDYLGDWCVFWGSGKYILQNISTGDIMDCTQTTVYDKEITGNRYENPREHTAMASDL